MARIKLAHWHDGHGPGDEVDVADEEVAGLVRDGRVAEVLDAPQDAPAPAQTEPAQPAQKRSSRKGD